MQTFWNIVKVGLPLAFKIIGFLIALKGTHEAGKATTGKYTFDQVAMPVYGQLAIGTSLLAGGIGTTMLINHRDKKLASESPPSVPPPNVDSVLHAMTVRQLELATAKGTQEADLDAMNSRVKEWRKALKLGVSQ